MTSLARGSIRALPAVGFAAMTACASLAAQDIEELARQRGITLPAAYYDRVRVDPTAYQFSRALFNRTGVRTTVAGPAGVPTRTASRGVVTLPVVLALFSDSPDPPHVTRAMIDQSLFSGPAARGTVTEAYLEMSRGALEVRGDVFDWVRSTLTLTEAVGASDGFGSDAQLGAYFTEALDAIDDGVDFALYDNDGPDGVANSGDDDGFVDVVTFEFLEIAASCGGPAIWPHRWRMTGQTGAPYATNDLSVAGDTIFIEDYITQSVADCTGLEVQDASTIAHEFGHALGLPDYYHPTAGGIGAEGRRWVMGCWALMAGGAWGCGRIGEERGAFGPTHMMAHSKYQLGWVEYFDVGEVWNEEVILDPVQTSGRALRLPMGDQGTEYLIAEYRAHYGFDDQLPADGVIMYKLDETASRRPDPGSGDPYFLTVLEQDGDRGLLRNHLEGGDRGVPGDAWGVDGVTAPLNAETIPPLRLSDGGRTPVMVHEVHVEGGQARLVISTGPTPRLVDPGQPLEVPRVRSFLESLRIAGGTGPYTPMGSLPDGVFLSTGGDELFVAGSVVDAGPHAVTVSVADAMGNTSNEIVLTLTAPKEWIVELAALLQAFLQSDVEPLTPGERDHLDSLGNQNGLYDVGDLRSWLRNAN